VAGLLEGGEHPHRAGMPDPRHRLGLVLDRVGAPGVLDALTTEPLPGPARIESVARAATVCPHELSVEHALVCDLVIGDYNQCFDPDFQLKRLFAEREWILVVDEAHQLPDRAMEHGSPALPLALAEAAVTATSEAGLDALHALAVEIRDEIAEAGLREDWTDGVEALSGDGDAPAVPELPVELPRRRWLDLRARIDEIALDHARLRPGGDEHEDPWMSLARAVLRFSEALQRAGEETVCLWTPPAVPGVDVPATAQPGLRLVCRDPHRILGPRFDEARASVLMSATLAPAWLLRERCGLAPDRARELYVPSPFPPENRRVVAVPGVSTAWKDREKHGAKIAATIDKTIEAIPGNVAVYVASYERMRDLLTRATFAGRPLLYQGPDTSDADRAALLAALVEPGPPRVLVAVLGGALSEGVDLPDQALAAAIIVGPALPPPSLERAMRVAWYEERYGGDGTTGFDLAYVQPGMTKAVQAAGRVVRGPEDRGLVVLLCQRFLRHEYAAYLPTEWTVEKSGRPWEVAADFFGEGGE